MLPCALFAILTTRLFGPLALFWPANAVLLGMLLRHPERASAAGWLGAALAYLAADRLAGTAWGPTLWLNLANLAGVAAGVLTATRLLPVEARRLDQPRSMLSVLVVCIAGATAESLVGGLASAILFARPLLIGVLDWFNGQLAVYIILTPLFLVAPRERPLRRLLGRRRPSGGWRSTTDLMPVAALALSLAGAILLGGPGVLALPVPALIWCALRYTVFTTLVLTALLSIAELFAIALGVMRLPDANLVYVNAFLSARLGIALVALGPMAVAIVNGARDDLLRRLDHMARYDHLTGVLQRGAFLESAAALLAGLAAAGRPAAVLMIDIDHFKQINDRFGHGQGDRVLAAVAGALQSGLRHGALLGRVGGEEFAVLLPETGAAEAARAAERLRLRVAALVQPDGPGADGALAWPHAITASFGLAVREAAEPDSLETLLARADAALYAAKAAGRNLVEVATA